MKSHKKEAAKYASSFCFFLMNLLSFGFFDLFTSKLTASRINIRSMFLADFTIDASLFQRIIKRENGLFVTSLILAMLIYRIIWDQVDIKTMFFVIRDRQVARLLLYGH